MKKGFLYLSGYLPNKIIIKKIIYILTYQRQRFEKHMQIFEDQLHYDPSMKLFHNLNQLLVYNSNVIVQSEKLLFINILKRNCNPISYFTRMQS